MTDLDTGPITDEEARQILSRFNASHFRAHDHEHARYSIPADPRRDDDIRLGAYIDQTEKLRADLLAAVRKVERVEALTTGLQSLVKVLQDSGSSNAAVSAAIYQAGLMLRDFLHHEALSDPPAQAGTDEESPYVCPGCHAIAEPCAPGCIDAAIEARREQDRDDYDADGLDDIRRPYSTDEETK